MKKEKTKYTKKWFQERIGKKVYVMNEHKGCLCRCCMKNNMSGMEITDNDRVETLFALHNEYGEQFTDKPYRQN